MSERSAITSVAQACDFMLRWAGADLDLAGPPIDQPFAIPDAVLALNSRLGQLWLHDSLPLQGVPSQLSKLFASQDTLLSPHDYQIGTQDIVPLIWENQCVWGCGYAPGRGSGLVDRLWVTGDWPDDLMRTGRDHWRQLQVPVEQAVVFCLLTNFCMASQTGVSDQWDKPAEADQLLGRFAPWAGFDGFWTDRQQSLIHLSGLGLTIHR